MDAVAVEGIDWSPRALKLMRSLPSYSDDLPLFQALLDEPSKLTLQVLQTLGVDEAAARAAAAAPPTPTVPAGRQPTSRAGSEERDGSWRTVTHTGFAPAPPAEVWALVTDPARRVEWDSLTVAAAQPVGTDVVELTARTSAADGRRIRVPANRVRMRQTVVDQTPHHIEWEITWPDVANSTALRLAIWLEPVAGGTRLELRNRWRPRRDLGGLLRTPLLPLVRFGMQQQLLHRAAGISRAVR